MRVRTMIATVALVGGFTALGTSQAGAESGTAYSTDGGTPGASTYFNDAEDRYRVCDREVDGWDAVGWIEVKQADGSWKRFSKVYARGGACVPHDTEVLREAADMRVWACLSTDPIAGLYACGSRLLQGVA